MNKTHSHSWTLHPWSGGAWRNQVILCSHQSAVCRHLHEEPWKTEIPRGKTHSPALKIPGLSVVMITYPQVVRWTSRRSVRNPGISYSDLLILIPGSRVISIWSLFMLFILRRSRPLSMTSLWHHGSRLLSLISYLWRHSDTIWYHYRDTPYRPMAFTPLISYQGCVYAYTYLTAQHVQTGTEQYIRLALQPVSITNYLVLVPPSSELWAHSHYAQVTPLS